MEGVGLVEACIYIKAFFALTFTYIKEGSVLKEYCQYSLNVCVGVGEAIVLLWEHTFKSASGLEHVV